MARLARVPSQTAGRAAPAIAHLIDQEFTTGRDPYGRAWAPLKQSTLAKGRRPPPLTDTGAMRAGVDVKPMQGAGIAITFANAVPAVFHQGGTRKMVARPPLPGGTFPATWARALETAGTAEITKTVRG